MKYTAVNIDALEIGFIIQLYVIFRISRKNDPIPMEGAECVLCKDKNVSAYTHE